jgi:hypothetical protein
LEKEERSQQEVEEKKKGKPRRKQCDHKKESKEGERSETHLFFFITLDYSRSVEGRQAGKRDFSHPPTRGREAVCKAEACT